MFNELAVKNVKKSLKDYAIYFITLVFGVILLYTFNSIEDHIKLLGGSAYMEGYIAFGRGIILFASVFICMIFGFLIAYANNFFIKRRKREFGVYTVLGMNKRDINKLMIKETLTIGLSALIIGLIIGIFVAQGIRVITLNMMNIEDNSFRFSISILAMIKTIIFFLLSLYFVNIFNKRSIKKHSLIDLLNADKKNEKSIITNKSSKIYLFLISIILIFIGYIIIPKDELPSWKKFLASSALIGYGTYLLFSSMVIIPFGISIAKSSTYDLKEATPFDASISKYYNEYTDKTAINDNLKREGINFKSLVSSSGELDKYESKDVKLNKFVLNGFKASKYTNYKSYLNDNVYLVGLSQYNQALKQQGIKGINLKEDEFAINCNSYEYKELYTYYIKNNKDKLNIEGFKLKLGQKKLYENSIATEQLATGFGEIIVPDKVLSKLSPRVSYMNFNYIKRNNEYDNMFMREYQKHQNNGLSFLSKLTIDGEKITIDTVLTFIAVDLGIILLISAGAVLALHQIAQSSKNKNRFKLLRDMGATKGEIKKSVIIQVLVTFSIPFIVALIHFSFIALRIRDIIAVLTTVNILKAIAITMVTILVIYGIYFAISIVESLRTLEE
ncbi:FtsX-like permease family protein [Paraclostridium sordellii]|uniref:FtsX-like permease family protein n=1 Tax=Paraclostridium sordellii TaxID=1505 RepID=UPI001C612E9C|nr:FtsX-like permease family protein [Paeniclostridium sordellii]QYE98576.1 FtsX-like permease family protein [Paeniclostridium sordellii]